MEKRGRKYVVFISFVAALGGLLFGYDWVVIGGAKPFYESFFGIGNDTVMQAWAMSSALAGCLVGALIAGACSDRYGRKRIFIAAAVIFIVSSLGTGAADRFSAFIAYRILGGLAIGIVSNLSPVYIAEVAPSAIRGRLVALNQLTMVIGILAAQIVNAAVAEPVPADATAEAIALSWNGTVGWRIMFWVITLPATLFLLLAFRIPESPRWLLGKGDGLKATRILERIGGAEYARAEYEAIASAPKPEKTRESRRALLHPSMRRVLAIGIVLAVFQQWCGINILFNYAQEIFAAAGYGISQTMMNIVVTGITNVIFTLVALFTVDRLGRRTLLLLGAAGLSCAYLILSLAYYCGVTGFPMLALVVAAIACYSVSLAPVMWVVVSEIFPTTVRGAAMGAATFALWTACFILTYTFPMLHANLGASGTFLLYGIICMAGLLFIIRHVPETKGKTLEEIERELVK